MMMKMMIVVIKKLLMIEVDKVLNQIKERFYKGHYVRHYEQ